MTYNLVFLYNALKEWNKLDYDIKSQFKQKLSERLKNPEVPKDKLSGVKDCYKIKLRTVGYRLVYRVIKDRSVVQVIAVAKRDKDYVCDLAKIRLQNIH